MNVENGLIEWTINYVKHKDLLKKELKDYKIIKNSIKFEFENRVHTYFVNEFFSSDLNIDLNDEYISFVVSNKKENINFLVDNWDEFLKNDKCNVFFVNFRTNQKMIVSPYIHNKISERSKLKTGLLSMLKNID